MTDSTSLLALTMGDPAGIGPEISIKAWQHLKDSDDISFIYLGCPDVIEKTARQLKLDLRLHICARADEALEKFSTGFPVLPVPCSAEVLTGKSSPTHTEAILRSISLGVEITRQHEVCGLVTNPIHKAALKKGAFSYPGHTEYLASLSNNAQPVMMLEGGGLRTIPLTRHIPLKDVSSSLDKQELIKTARILHKALQTYYDITAPRIAVSGLNPHAGEDGVLGTEEDDIIRPAISVLQSEGLTVTGPLSADTMFHEAARARYDAAICMYHDQALIPVKMLGFDTGVNITLGLDFIRTSPDHGTALDIAPKYCANPDSLISALKRAALMHVKHARIESK